MPAVTLKAHYDGERIVLDEPFSGIDPIAVYDIQGIIGQLKDRGIGLGWWCFAPHEPRHQVEVAEGRLVLLLEVVRRRLGGRWVHGAGRQRWRAAQRNSNASPTNAVTNESSSPRLAIQAAR